MAMISLLLLSMIGVLLFGVFVYQTLGLRVTHILGLVQIGNALGFVSSLYLCKTEHEIGVGEIRSCFNASCC